MRYRVLLAVTLFAPTVLAQDPVQTENPAACTSDSVCIPREDLAVFVQLLKERQCLVRTKPEITLSPIPLVIDRQGRVYGETKTTLLIQWCNFEITGGGPVKIDVAVQDEPVPPPPKPSLWQPALRLGVGYTVQASWDAFLLVSPLAYRGVSLNGHAGVRSIGGGLGYGVTSYGGFYAGYSYSYEGKHGATLGVYGRLWLVHPAKRVLPTRKASSPR